MEINNIYCGDNVALCKELDDCCIDLTVTSPPYDNLRTYNGYEWDFKALARELYRVTKDGSVVVWVVGDATINGSETGTSFRQALYFMECGFNLHDTMIWDKGSYSAVGSLVSRYAPVLEYMFILTKGKLNAFNPIKDKRNKHVGVKIHGTTRQPDGSTRPAACIGNSVNEFSQRHNIWRISPVKNNSNGEHPAPYPEALANDHIISWSNKGDTILDPFIGSGTTAKMALMNERNFIGFEISQEYVDLANERIKGWKEQTRLF